jgi:organic hydroperoxide reductase OsmC/OhrA
MSTYTAKVSWAHKPEERFTDGKYSRAHEWAFDGGAVVPASSSPHVVKVPLSDPAGVDPEEALVAALSSCHMLFFLDFARHKGFVVERYVDDAEGVVKKGADGRVQMTLVTLKPHIVFAGEKRPTEVDVEAIHHHAHEACYIANSVKSEIVIDGACEGLMPT